MFALFPYCQIDFAFAKTKTKTTTTNATNHKHNKDHQNQKNLMSGETTWTFKWLLTSPYCGIMCTKLYDLWVAERLSCPPLTAFAIKVNPPWGIYDSSYHFAFYSGHCSPHKLSNCILECSFNKSLPNFRPISDHPIFKRSTILEGEKMPHLNDRYVSWLAYIYSLSIS